MSENVSNAVKSELEKLLEKTDLKLPVPPRTEKTVSTPPSWPDAEDLLDVLDKYGGLRSAYVHFIVHRFAEFGIGTITLQTTPPITVWVEIQEKDRCAAEGLLRTLSDEVSTVRVLPSTLIKFKVVTTTKPSIGEEESRYE